MMATEQPEPRRIWRRRALAFMFDVGLAGTLSDWLAGQIVSPQPPGTMVIVRFLVVFLYRALPALTPSRSSLGKLVFGLRTASGEGGPPSIAQAMRHAFALAVLFGLGPDSELQGAGGLPVAYSLIPAGIGIGYMAASLALAWKRPMSLLPHERWSGVRVVRDGSPAPLIDDREERRWALFLVMPVVVWGCMVCLLAMFTGGQWKEFFRTADPAATLPSIQRQLARDLHLRSAVGFSKRREWSSGGDTSTTLILNVDLPWGATDDNTVHRVYRAVTDSLKVDSRYFRRFEIVVGGELSGLVKLDRHFLWTYAWDSTTSRWIRSKKVHDHP